MCEVTVSVDNQITIPEDFRRVFGIQPGTRLQIAANRHGMKLFKAPENGEINGLLKGMHVEDWKIRDESDRHFP